MTNKSIPVNGRRFRSARLELGLSAREVARRAQISLTILTSIEKQNKLTAMLPIAVLERAAQTVGLSITEILEVTPPARDSDESSSANLQRLATMLIHESPQLVPRQDLARVLAVTSEELRALELQLDAPLGELGLRLHRNRALLGVRSNVHSAESDGVSLARRKIRRTDLHLYQASLVHQALCSRIPELVPHAQKPHLGLLLRIGVLESRSTPTARFSLADAAKYAFPDIGVQGHRNTSGGIRA